MRIFSIILIVLAIGCSPPPQLRKLVFGTSLQDFDVAKKKYTKTVTMPLADCFKKVHDILEKRQAIIEKSDLKNNFITVYGFNDYFKSKSIRTGINTTEVGIMLKEVSKDKTEIIIISDDYLLGEFVSNEIFKKLETK